MMYAMTNYKTKKALKEAVAASPNGEGVACFQPGPFGNTVADGENRCCEGPHYPVPFILLPAPHRWYAACTVRNGRIIKVR